MEGFQRIMDALKALGARVVGISADTWAAQGAFAKQHGLEFPLLSDWPDRKTIEAFGVEREGAMPIADRITFVFDADRVVRAVINDSKDMEAHPTGALAAIKELTQ